MKTRIILTSLTTLLLCGLSSSELTASHFPSFSFKNFHESSFDPEDVDLLVPEIIEKYGYPCESHSLTTTDGYILTLHRIPHGRNDNIEKVRPVVYLQHGILLSSADWILTRPEKALGYKLADAGYDVWLGNARGNRYSRSHLSLNPDKKEFWNFTFHEIGVYDVPASIDYVLQQTNQSKLYYIGHSQGTTVFYIMCSEKPEYNKKIKIQMSLSPVAYRNHMSNVILQIAARLSIATETLSRYTGYSELLPRTTFVPYIAKLFCSDSSITQSLCVTLWFVFFGYDRKEVNPSQFPLIAGHSPAGISTKQAQHYSQQLRSGKFSKWDGGYTQNMKLYNTTYPPEYVLEKVTAPVYLYHSQNDALNSLIDVNRLYKRLPNVIMKVLIEEPEFNHMDFLYGKHAPELVYELLFNAMSAFP